MTSPGCNSPAYILVFGLSADPVHQGHIQLALSAAQGMLTQGYAVTRIVFVPVYRRSPVGGDKDWLPVTFEHRYRMCELAAQDMRDPLPGIHVEASRVEADLVQHNDKPNLTAETLQALKRDLPENQRLAFLISSELVSGDRPQFSRWYRPDLILDAATLAICPRPGYEANMRYLASLVASGADVVYMPQVRTPDVAANEVRSRLCAGVSPLALAEEGVLSQRVAAYIEAEQIYATCTW